MTVHPSLITNMDKLWNDMTAEEKKIQLYIKQKNTLDSFLARNAISEDQYKKSLGDLTEKMGMNDVLDRLNEGEK